MVSVSTVQPSLNHCFVEHFEISKSIWQKKIVTCRFVSFFSKIQNPGQITRPSIDMTAVLKGKSDKNFKKVVPIRGNLFYSSQCFLFWCNLIHISSIHTNFFLSNWYGHLKSNIEMFYEAVSMKFCKGWKPSVLYYLGTLLEGIKINHMVIQQPRPNRS